MIVDTAIVIPVALLLVCLGYGLCMLADWVLP